MDDDEDDDDVVVDVLAEARESPNDRRRYVDWSIVGDVLVIQGAVPMYCSLDQAAVTGSFVADYPRVASPIQEEQNAGWMQIL